MTRRERLERKLEKRAEWAEGRRKKAEQCFKRGEPYRGDVAFNTQPGHIPERARVIAAIDRGVEHDQMARHHDSKAAGLAHQLERTVFSDDPDAIEQLEAKARNLEAQREHCKRVNAAFRKAGKPKPDDSEGWRKVADILGAADNDLRAIRMDMARCHWHTQPFPAYVMTNKGAEIRRCRVRIEEIRARQKRTEAAEQAGGVVITRYPEHDWCVVTFAEKPERSVLEALREAGYRWGAGCWKGSLKALPGAVEALA